MNSALVKSRERLEESKEGGASAGAIEMVGVSTENPLLVPSGRSSGTSRPSLARPSDARAGVLESLFAALRVPKALPKHHRERVQSIAVVETALSDALAVKTLGEAPKERSEDAVMHLAWSLSALPSFSHCRIPASKAYAAQVAVLSPVHSVDRSLRTATDPLAPLRRLWQPSPELVDLARQASVVTHSEDSDLLKILDGHRKEAPAFLVLFGRVDLACVQDDDRSKPPSAFRSAWKGDLVTPIRESAEKHATKATDSSPFAFLLPSSSSTPTPDLAEPVFWTEAPIDVLPNTKVIFFAADTWRTFTAATQTTAIKVASSLF